MSAIGRCLRASALVICASRAVAAQADTTRFTHADTLRGSNGPARAWWDVSFYDLHVRVNPADSSIRGWNAITYRVTKPARALQIDLQTPLEVDSVVQDGKSLTYTRDGNAFFVATAAPQRAGTRQTLRVYYHGKPRAARTPPWDGGYIWRHAVGQWWVATANQGLGASVWWPNKDTQLDEPDSQRIAITVPDPLVDVSNGRLRSAVHNADGTTTYEWFVTEPINNYDVSVNAGVYAHYSDVFHGEGGALSLDFWPLANHVDDAHRQWQQVEPMLRCFEHWFGPYPWYQDGYKLVEAPHLGMEHQSAVAYGNRFQNGYLGGDRSTSSYGLSWDFIIIHESAHEWWGNSLTAADPADGWIHESFADYAEGLYTECREGKAAGAAYLTQLRFRIRNRQPIVAPYGVNGDPPSDVYEKGGNLLHTIRQVVNDDEKWRAVLRGLQSTYRHQVVTGRQVEDYMSLKSGVDLRRVFDQYLRTAKVPVLEYRLADSTLSYRWTNVVPGFAMPVRVTTSDSTFTWVRPTETWRVMRVRLSSPAAFRVDENFYVTAKPAP